MAGVTLKTITKNVAGMVEIAAHQHAKILITSVGITDGIAKTLLPVRIPENATLQRILTLTRNQTTHSMSGANNSLKSAIPLMTANNSLKSAATMAIRAT